jgi:hypothetical protein
MKKEALTERLGVGVTDHPLKSSLVRRKLSVPVQRLLQQPGLLLQFPPQLPCDIGKLLSGLLQLGIAGSYGFLQRPRML